ncbi:MAG: hypothetical protein ABTQ26_19590 [Azonexus sp.]
MSRTQQALALWRSGQTPYAAAKEVGLSPTALYAAIKREEAKNEKEPCPCCGTLVPGEKINRDVLKDSTK